MKRIAMVLTLVGIFVWVGVSNAEYTIIQLTTNDYRDRLGQLTTNIDSNGNVVWYGYVAEYENAEIFLYDGSTVERVTNNTIRDEYPNINDNGLFVWGGGVDIYLYDGSLPPKQITSTTQNNSPHINNNNVIVWSGFDGSDNEIYIYDGSTIEQISNNSISDELPQIADNNFIVWQGFDGNDYEIFIYKGSTIEQITDNDYQDQWPKISDNGLVVWEGDRKIYYYDGISVSQISSGSAGNANINKNGLVVWNASLSGSAHVYLYDGVTVKQLSGTWTSGSTSNRYPRISDAGLVVWQGYKGGNDTEIFFYDGTTVTQITDNSVNDEKPQVDSNGLIAWEANDGNDLDIFVAVPDTQPSTLTVTEPDGGEVLPKGTEYMIRWDSANVSGDIQIDLYKGGTEPANFVIQLAANEPNDGSYPFNPPDDLEDGSDYYIGISAESGTVWDFSDTPFTIVTPTESERYALIALYNSTNGDEWFDNSGWKAPPLHEDGFALPGTECSWYGMDCSFPNTIQIRLVINNLNGSIPAEIGNLTSLINLRLMNNRELTGSIPPEIGNLANLQILNLIGNQLNGTIPVELSNLADLGSLALWNNQFTGTIPAELSKLSKLGYLGLDGNQFTGNIPAWLGDLVNLQHLSLGFNQFTGEIPAELSKLSNLRWLYLSSNQLTGNIPSWLGNLINLQTLKLSDNQLTGNIPGELMNMTSLSTLDICDNHLYSSNSDLRDFLNGLQPEWESCQTPPFARAIPCIPLLLLGE